MITQIDPISTPPTPADTPADFEQKASQVWGDLFKAVPQMNEQALEIEAIGRDADAARQVASEASDAAMGYRNEARSAKDAALVHASSSEAFSIAAGGARTGAEAAAGTAGNEADRATAAAAVAAGHAANMGQAIAMAATFSAVPASFQAWMIVVTQPHVRFMVWNGAAYVRAPWHQPCQLFFSYDNPATISGALPVRADSVWQQAQFPDVVGRLGLSGVGTFSLVEARGEFLRVLDNGRGVDVGRSVRSAQGDAIRDIKGTFAGGEASGSPGSGAFNREGVSSSQNGNVYPQSFYSFAASRVVPVASENRPRNLPFPLWMTI